MTAEISSSFSKVFRWAEAEIEKFDATLQKFLQECPTDCIETIEPITGARVVYPRKIEIPPETLDTLESSAYRIINDLRNSLDQACHAVSIAIGSSNRNYTNFPISLNEVDLEKRLSNPKGSFRGIPVEMHSTLMELRPFKAYTDGREGNARLWTIMSIANPNKHREPLNIAFSQDGVGIMECFGLDLKINPDNSVSGEGVPEVHFWPREDAWSLKLNFSKIVRLREAGIFNQYDATVSFRMMLQIVKEAILALESCRDEVLSAK